MPNRELRTLKYISLAGFLAMVTGLLGLIVQRSLFFLFLPNIVIQIGAVLLMLRARKTLGKRSFTMNADSKEGDLVTHGPFRFIRHPIYTAVCLFVWPGVLFEPSIYALLLALLVTTGALIRMFCEEHVLMERYPEYRKYASMTKRMIPYIF